MKYLDAAGVHISRIGLGTWQFGSTEWGYGSDFASEKAPALVRRARDLGINLIDTAEMYGFGRSEKVVGRAIATHRDDYFIATKLAPVLPVPPIAQFRAHRSASRLGLKEIDLYQLHWPNRIVPLGITISALKDLRDGGLVRNIGVSNYGLTLWQKAEEILGSPVISNQVELSLVKQKPLKKLVPHAAENDRIVIAYSPLAKGLLSGRYSADETPTNLVRRRNSHFKPEFLDRARPLFEALKEIADGHDATQSQIALAWVISHPNTVAIPGASSVEQLEQNARVAEIDLTAEEVDRLTEAGRGLTE